MADEFEFEEALSNLVAEHLKKGTDPETIISALELQIMAMKEEHGEG